MRILLLCHKPPWPPVDGGTYASWQMARGLAEAGHEVRVLALATPKHPASERPPPALGVTQETVAHDPTPGLAGAAANLLTSRPFPIDRFRSADLAARIGAQRGLDLVQIEGLAMAVHLEEARALEVLCVMRVIDVEHELWRLRAARAAAPVRAWLELQARRLRRFEIHAWNACDGLLAISDDVAAACRRHSPKPVETVTVGADVAAAAPPLPSDMKALLHLGAMDWAPNRDGMSWFLAEVWPMILARAPRATMVLAGRGSSAFARKRPAAGLVAVGEVDDTTALLRRHAIVVAPVRFGSGVRVKIVEAMAQGRAVATTAAGAAGLHVTAGRELVIADDAVRLAAAIGELLEDPVRTARLGRQAWEHAAAHHRPEALASTVTSFYHGLRSSTPVHP